MSSDYELLQALEAFLAAGTWNGARLLSDGERKVVGFGHQYRHAIEGDIELGGITVKVRLGFKSAFPDVLPVAWLAEPGSLGRMPHEEPHGKICYQRQEGIVLNRHNPGAIIQYALTKVTELLKQGISGSNRMDFMEEFASYWRLLNTQPPIKSLVLPSNSPKLVTVISCKDEDTPEWIADNIEQVEAFAKGESLTRKFRPAIYVPLCRDTFLIPPETGQFWKLKDIRFLLRQHVNPYKRKGLNLLIRKRNHKSVNELLVLGVPRPGGGETLVGIEFINIEGNHPLFPNGKCVSIKPISIERMDKALLLPRGGASLGLSTKRVLVIGCGAIGGYVANALASTGIGNITLVDDDVLKPENIYRHFAGKFGLNYPKVSAVKVDLKSRYPFLEVETIAEKIEKAIERKLVDLVAFDAIIIALGVATVELRLNDLLYKLERVPPTVFSWLEPLGIGGHALLTGGWGYGWQRAGCMECLYTSSNESATSFVPNRSAFAAPGLDFTRDMQGCGGAYVPFGGLDAMRTAEMAVRLLMSAIDGSEKGHPLISWKGSAKAFEAEGFKASQRFSFSEEQMNASQYDYRIKHCRVCGHIT